MSNLHSLREGFTDEHLPMFLLLGVASSLESFVAKLPAPEADPRGPAEQGETEIDQLLALVLGLVSLNNTLEKIRNAALDSKPEPEPPAKAEAMPLRELLR